MDKTRPHRSVSYIVVGISVILMSENSGRGAGEAYIVSFHHAMFLQTSSSTQIICSVAITVSWLWSRSLFLRSFSMSFPWWSSLHVNSEMEGLRIAVNFRSMKGNAYGEAHQWRQLTPAREKMDLGTPKIFLRANCRPSSLRKHSIVSPILDQSSFSLLFSVKWQSSAIRPYIIAK